MKNEDGLFIPTEGQWREVFQYPFCQSDLFSSDSPCRVRFWREQVQYDAICHAKTQARIFVNSFFEQPLFPTESELILFELEFGFCYPISLETANKYRYMLEED